MYSVQTILLSLQSLLGGMVVLMSMGRLLTKAAEPNNASPLNPDAANLWDKPDGMCEAPSQRQSADNRPNRV